MQKVTLKIIAEKLKISVATVSKALKNYPDVNNETRLKVLNLAKALNYKPNSFAQSLRNQESRVVGLIIPEIVHHFFSNIINGVINTAEKEGYLVIVLKSDESNIHEKELLEVLVRKNVDGILLSLSGDTIRFNHIKEIIHQGTPIVLYDRISRSINCSKVIIDDVKAAFNATEYLIKTGCKKIAHLSGVLKPQTTIDRLKGYRRALEKHDIIYDKSLVYVSENLSYEDGYTLASKMISDHPDLDGVFALTDLLATGILARFKEMKIDVPNKISIMGFSNWFLTQITSPKLSTINQPGYEMGEKAFKLLLENIKQLKEGGKSEPQIIELPTHIIARGSTKGFY